MPFVGKLVRWSMFRDVLHTFSVFLASGITAERAAQASAECYRGSLLAITPRNRSQLSLRALFFLQIQAAVIMLFVTLAVSRQASPIPLVVGTFLLVTVFSGMVGTVLSILFSTRWWMIVGPAVGAAVGLIASALTLSPTNNFPRLMYASIVSSTLLILASCWLGRSIPQEESIMD